MLKRFKNSYYSKIMIVCIAAVCAITAILLPVCSSLIHQQERSEDLKKIRSDPGSADCFYDLPSGSSRHQSDSLFFR